MNNFSSEQMANLFGGAVMIGSFVVSMAIAVVVCLILQSCYNAIPQQYRRMESGLVWLLLIPLFNIVWIYFAFIRLSKSFGDAYAAQNRQVDTGEKLALACCITVSVCCVPCLGFLAMPVALVLLIMTLMRFNQLKNDLGQTPNPY